MKLALVIIGNELLRGQVKDKNLTFLASWLEEQGESLSKAVFLSDNEKELVNGLKDLSKEYDVIITSGGLGPTRDDITKNALSALLSTPISKDQHASELTQHHYARIGKEWGPHINDYGLIPQNSFALENPVGLAPGLAAKYQESFIYMAPGVPSEFSAMVKAGIWSDIKEKCSLTSLQKSRLNFRTFGVPEEQIFRKLDPTLWEKLSDLGDISSLPGPGGVDITLSLSGNKDEIDRKSALAREIVSQSPISQSLWHTGDESAAEVLLKLLKEQSLNLGTAESCTGGLVGSILTDVPGSSESYQGGVISYSNKAKESFLGVLPSTLAAYGAVSEQVALEMAQGARSVLKSNIGLSLTGIAGPGGGTKERPVGTVWLGLALPGKSYSYRFQFHGNRKALKTRFAFRAIYETIQVVKGLKT